jgi:hypothetical protein
MQEYEHRFAIWRSKLPLLAEHNNNVGEAQVRPSPVAVEANNVFGEGACA